MAALWTNHTQSRNHNVTHRFLVLAPFLLNQYEDAMVTPSTDTDIVLDGILLNCLLPELYLKHKLIHTKVSTLVITNVVCFLDEKFMNYPDSSMEEPAA